MLTAGIIVSIIGIIVFLFIGIADDDAAGIGALGSCLFLVDLMLLVGLLCVKNNTIKCLNDNNPYKMEIVYELKDSVYIPKDTIYVLK